MMGPYWMRGFGSMLLMGFFWIVVIGIVIWGFSVILRRPKEPERSISHADSPMEILKRRYAKGEIDQEEYETKKKDLSQ